MWTVTLMVSQKPARASSMALSTTSYTKWCNPWAPVDPMYMAGRFRTASSPSSTLILSAPYSARSADVIDGAAVATASPSPAGVAATPAASRRCSNCVICPRYLGPAAGRGRRATRAAAPAQRRAKPASA